MTTPGRSRALFIGINHRYVNPTNSLIPALVGKLFDVHFYGPGFVGNATLQDGVDRYVDALGGVDRVFTTSQCVGGFGAERLDRFLSRYAVVLNNGAVSPYFLNDVEEFCRKNQNRVTCFLTDVDPHAVEQATLDSLLRHAGYFVCWGKGFVESLGDSEAVKNEKYLQVKLKKSIPLGLLDDFVEHHSMQIVNLGHFVADNEFHWGSLANRKYDAAVPGSRYARRQAVLSALGKEKGVSLAGLRYRYLYQLAARLGLRPFANYYGVQLYNLAFQRAMSRTKVCITDGGGNNYPVRKFFEIPAAGALMVCWPSVGLESLGFKDGHNCIFARSEADVIRTIRAVARDAGPFESIAEAGRNLVFHQHSVSARSNQLSEAISRIDAGDFIGSSWRDGRFHCATDSSETFAQATLARASHYG